MTAESTIDYEGLAQEAMRGVVRTVLARTAKDGLSGDHHFYISFDTEAEGVILSRRLKEKYPREMTIVLQHRFWGLSVSDDRFEVKLTFDGIPERLVIPFAAVKVFFDPSVRFGLQFEPGGVSGDAGDADNAFDAMKPRNGTPRAVAGRSRVTRSSRRKTSPAAGGNEAETGAVVAGPGSDRLAEATVDADEPREDGKLVEDGRSADAGSMASVTADAASDNEMQTDESESAPSGGAEIVSLDQFRKK